jgi:hypothetical protein
VAVSREPVEQIGYTMKKQISFHSSKKSEKIATHWFRIAFSREKIFVVNIRFYGTLPRKTAL